MLEFAFWIIIGFISGSVPWALVIGRLFTHNDIRSVGDGNPGAANAWKSGGWIPGIVALILEMGKSLAPVYLAVEMLGKPSNAATQVGMALVAISPILGHGWSPFLRFSGGKTLASSWGSWIAVTGGVGFPVACVFLGLFHALQKNHAMTVTLCLILSLAVFLPLQMQPYIVMFWIMNLAIIIYKHRDGYSDGIILRSWVTRIKRTLP